MTLLQLRHVLVQEIYRLHPAKLLKNVQSGISASFGIYLCDWCHQRRKQSCSVVLRDTALHVAAMFVAGMLLAELVAMPENFTTIPLDQQL